MKRFYLLSVATLVVGIVALLSTEASAGPKTKNPHFNNTIKPIINKSGSSSGTATATGGAGGSAKGPGAQGGSGGGAVAVGGNNSGTIINGNNNTITKVTNKNIFFRPVFGHRKWFGGGGFSGGSGAVAGAGGDGDDDDDDSEDAIVSTPTETDVSTDGTPAIGTNGADSVSSEPAEREEIYNRRFLKVKNDADVVMKVFVQYRGLNDKKWSWVPADPTASQDAVVAELKPGQEIFVEHKTEKVSASRVRVWAVAQSQTWLDYRDQDLWIVPEVDQRGDHHYLATEMKTFTFIFPKLQGN